MSTFRCRKCSATVVLGSPAESLSDDARDQLMRQLCTKHWREETGRVPAALKPDDSMVLLDFAIFLILSFGAPIWLAYLAMGLR